MFTGNDEFNESQESRSLWMDISLPSFPHLKTSIDTDVCIVGGGIVDLTNAYTLAKQGKSVVVLDQGSIGGEQTLRTTAHLAWALDDRFYELERIIRGRWCSPYRRSLSLYKNPKKFNSSSFGLVNCGR